MKIYIPEKNTAWGVIKHPVKGNQYFDTVDFLKKDGTVDYAKRDEYINNQFFGGKNWKTEIDKVVDQEYDWINENKFSFSTNIRKQPHFSSYDKLANSDFCIVKNEQGEYFFYVLLPLKKNKASVKFEAELDIFFSYPEISQFANALIYLQRGFIDRYKIKNNQVLINENVLLNNDEHNFPLISTSEHILDTPNDSFMQETRFILIYVARRLFQPEDKKPAVRIETILNKGSAFQDPILNSTTLFLIPYHPTATQIIWKNTEAIDVHNVEGIPAYFYKIADSIVDIQIINTNFLPSGSLLRQGNFLQITHKSLAWSTELKCIYIKNLYEFSVITQTYNMTEIKELQTQPKSVSLTQLRDVNNEMKLLNEYCLNFNIVSKSNQKRSYPAYTVMKEFSNITALNRYKLEVRYAFNFEPKDPAFMVWLEQKHRSSLFNQEIFVNKDFNSLGIFISARDTYLRDNESQIAVNRNYLRQQMTVESAGVSTAWSQRTGGGSSASDAELELIAGGQKGIASIPFVGGLFAGSDNANQIIKHRTGMRTIDAKITDMLNRPAKVMSGAGPIINWILGKWQDIHLQIETLNDYHKQLLADYFAYNGYKIEKFVKFKDYRNNRYRWNYVKGTGMFATISLKLSARQKQIIDEAIANGITFWHYRNKDMWKGIMAYAYENWEMTLLQNKKLI